MSKLDDFLGVLLIWGISLYLVFGGFYWVYTAIKLQNLFMLIGGVVPPAWIITAPVGAWAFLYGWPGWVVELFGLGGVYSIVAVIEAVFNQH